MRCLDISKLSIRQHHYCCAHSFYCSANPLPRDTPRTPTSTVTPGHYTHSSKRRSGGRTVQAEETRRKSPDACGPSCWCCVGDGGGGEKTPRSTATFGIQLQRRKKTPATSRREQIEARRRARTPSKRKPSSYEIGRLQQQMPGIVQRPNVQANAFRISSRKTRCTTAWTTPDALAAFAMPITSYVGGRISFRSILLGFRDTLSDVQTQLLFCRRNDPTRFPGSSSAKKCVQF